LFNLKSKNVALTGEELYLGEKRVKIEKLTIVKWRELFAVVDKLPGLLVQVLTAPQTDFYSYIITALDISLDEIANIVAVLSGLDVDYVKNNVGIDEMFEYLTRTVKKNRLDTVVKNVQSLLPNKK
jgi:hypothetical protein